MPRAFARALATLCLACSAGCSEEAEPEPAPIDPDAPIVPEETASELALARLADWRGLPVPRSGRYLQQSSHERSGSPPASVSLLQKGNRDLNNFVCRSADAEMATSLVEPWFDLESCPEDWVKGLVMARVEGSGMLTRLQLTQLSLRAAPADEEILRVYVDGAHRPLIQLPLASVLDGSAGEIFAPPFGRGSPHHLAWYYPIRFDERLIVSLDRVGPLDLVYYQADFVLDEEHGPAGKARRPERDAAKSLLDAQDPAGELASLASKQGASLSPSSELELASLSGPATVHAFELRIAESDLPLLEGVTLRVHWDSEPTPAIELPLSFWFASALARPTRSSLALASTKDQSSVTLKLRLPMPFASQASFRLVSAASAPLAFDFEARGEKSVPEGFLRLHAEARSTLGPTTQSHHPVAKTTGRGRFVGNCLMMEGHELSGTSFASPLNFLEGDFRGTIDGELRLLDTGSEDHFDSCFYFESGELGFAFAQAWGIDAEPPAGSVSACRWNVLTDVMDYQESFELDLEIGPGAPELLDRYRSVAFFYQ